MFALSLDQLTRLAAWKLEQDGAIAALPAWRKQVVSTHCSTVRAESGHISYTFTPLAMGVMIRVHHNVTGSILDLTETG